MKVHLNGGVIGLPLDQFTGVIQRLERVQISLSLVQISSLKPYTPSANEPFQIVILAGGELIPADQVIPDDPIYLKWEKAEQHEPMPGIIGFTNEEELFYAIRGIASAVERNEFQQRDEMKKNQIEPEQQNGQAPSLFPSTQGLIDILSVEEHRKLLSAILESTTDVVAYTDPNNVIRYMNKIAMDRLGVKDQADLASKSPLIFFHPDDQDYMVNYVLPEAKEKGICSGEYKMVDKNGQPFPVSFVVQCHRTSTGEAYFSLIARDITEEKAREKQLFKTKQLYETLVEATNEIIVVFTKTGKINYVNKIAAELFGQNQQDLIGHDYTDMLNEKVQKFASTIQKIYDTNHVAYIEDIVEKNGQSFWFGSWLVPIKDDTDEVVAIMSVSRDISKEKESEFSLIQALDKERQFNELQSRFVSMISHEFKTPLSTILSSVEILQNYSDQLSVDKKLAHGKRIEKAVSVMNYLLEDILFIGRIKEKEMELRPLWIDPIEFCAGLVEETLWNDKSDHPIKFVVSGNCSKALIDPDFLKHILDNLLNNAIKFSDSGSKIIFTVDCTSTNLTFVISDEGIGIPAEDLPRVFDPFFRAKNHSTVPGTGLGLNIVKRAVELLNGSIAIKSEPGKGTQVSITIPLTIGTTVYGQNSGN